MKRFLSLVVGLGCLCAAVQAEVPSLINYQGRLTDKAGTPVNGAVDVVLRVYDAKTEGKKVYEETISQVSVVNGVYSFGYGGAGKSTKRSAEVVAVADGETKVFNYSTAHKPLLMDVQLSDGTYTWGSSSGPSDAAQFIGSINAELGNVTAIYIQNAPAKNTFINAVYHYHEEGIIGALSQNKECWQELTIKGKTLSPRERLVSVPFALVSKYSLEKMSKKIIHPLFYVAKKNDPMHGMSYNPGFSGHGRTGGTKNHLLNSDLGDSFELAYKFTMISYKGGISIRLFRSDFVHGSSPELIKTIVEQGFNVPSDGSKPETIASREMIKIPNYMPSRYKYNLEFTCSKFPEARMDVDHFYLID
jgi:hypothetical protein